jgi:excisionase family DNA binding protein
MPQSKSTQDKGEWLSASEAAEYLRVSHMTVCRWCDSDLLPAFRVADEWRINRRIVEEKVGKKS